MSRGLGCTGTTECLPCAAKRQVGGMHLQDVNWGFGYLGDANTVYDIFGVVSDNASQSANDSGIYPGVIDTSGGSKTTMGLTPFIILAAFVGLMAFAQLTHK